MTTLEPRAPYTPEELDRLYPKSLALQQVQIIHRHGERSPVSPRFQNAGLTPYWPYCTSARMLKSIVMMTPDAANWDVLQWKRELETLGPRDTPTIAKGPHGQHDTVCLAGETTDKGRATTYALGQRLRHLYVDKLKFMPVTLTSTSNMYLRCTMIPRALDAMQQSFAGMYPPAYRAASLEPPVIHARIFQEENLTDNERTCKRYGLLYRAFGERAAGRWNDSPEMAYINKKIGKYMEGGAEIKIDSKPRLSGIMDTINSTRAHGEETKLPKEFYDEQLLANVDKMVVEEWFAGYEENEEFRRLGKGQMVGDVTGQMVDSALGRGKPEPVKFALTGAHDTTLAGFLASLGAFEGEKWPRFTSNVAVELFRDSTSTPPSQNRNTQAPAAPRTSWFTSLFGGSKSSDITAHNTDSRKPLPDFSPSEREVMKDYYVRIRYNDRPVTIPGCTKAGRHHPVGGESFCTLEAFKQIADIITPLDWRKECSTGLDEKIDLSKSKVVRAGYPAGEAPTTMEAQR